LLLKRIYVVRKYKNIISNGVTQGYFSTLWEAVSGAFPFLDIAMIRLFCYFFFIDIYTYQYSKGCYEKR